MVTTENGAGVWVMEKEQLYVPAPPPGFAAPRKRLPRRVVTTALPEPYHEFSITAWVNFPRSVALDLRSRDQERTGSALRQVILAHDLVDEDGEPYPLADDPAFWEVISDDLGAAIVLAALAQIGRLDPKPAAT